MSTPYERILELARREATLVDEGRLEELAHVWSERDEVVAALGSKPPLSARGTLLETERIVHATRARICRLLQELGEQIAQLSSGRRTAAGGGGSRSPQTLDVHGSTPASADDFCAAMDSLRFARKLPITPLR